MPTHANCKTAGWLLLKEYEKPFFGAQAKFSLPSRLVFIYESLLCALCNINILTAIKNEGKCWAKCAQAQLSKEEAVRLRQDQRSPTRAKWNHIPIKHLLMYLVWLLWKRPRWKRDGMACTLLRPYFHFIEFLLMKKPESGRICCSRNSGTFLINFFDNSLEIFQRKLNLFCIKDCWVSFDWHCIWVRMNECKCVFCTCGFGWWRKFEIKIQEIQLDRNILVKVFWQKRLYFQAKFSILLYTHAHIHVYV